MKFNLTRTRVRPRFLAALQMIIALLTFLFACQWGSSELVFSDLWYFLFPGDAPRTIDEDLLMILFEIRLPRVLAAALCGAALGASGALSQGLFKNVLASPSVLGISAGGAAAGAASFFWTAAMVQTWWVLPSAAFLGCMGTALLLLIIYVLARIPSIEVMLLMGMAFSSFLGALTSLIIALSTDDVHRLPTIMYWLMGAIDTRPWSALGVSATLLFGALFGGIWLAPRLDVMCLDDDTAKSLGISVFRTRCLVVCCLAALEAAAITIAGTISFMGLVVPHITRVIMGARHRSLIFYSAINGMTLLVLADLCARTWFGRGGVQVGVLTALMGAPFFFVLLMQHFRGHFSLRRKS